MRSVSHDWFVGVDLHRDMAQVCWRDRSGEIAGDRRFGVRGGSGREALLDWIADLGGARVAVEALGLNRWFVNGLVTRGLVLGEDIRVAHPPALKLREAGRKTDRRDARELSRRLWLGDLDRVGRTHYPSDDEHDSRQVIRTRRHLVSMRQRLINRLRAFFRSYAIPMPRGRLYSRCNVEWLRGAVERLPAGTSAARSCVQLLEVVQAEIEDLDGEISRRGSAERRVGPLLDLPQVGEQTALTLLRELGDWRRFDNARSVASYAGLVPRVADSSDKEWHGRLVRHGNRTLRGIVGQWAVRLMTTDARARRWAQQRQHRVPKNKLRTALARRLLVGVYVSLRDEVPFSLERCLGES